MASPCPAAGPDTFGSTVCPLRHNNGGGGVLLWGFSSFKGRLHFVQASPAAQRVPADRARRRAALWLVPVCGDAGAGARPPLHLPLCHR